MDKKDKSVEMRNIFIFLIVLLNITSIFSINIDSLYFEYYNHQNNDSSNYYYALFSQYTIEDKDLLTLVHNEELTKHDKKSTRSKQIAKNKDTKPEHYSFDLQTNLANPEAYLLSNKQRDYLISLIIFSLLGALYYFFQYNKKNKLVEELQKANKQLAIKKTELKKKSELVQEQVVELKSNDKSKQRIYTSNLVIQNSTNKLLDDIFAELKGINESSYLAKSKKIKALIFNHSRFSADWNSIKIHFDKSQPQLLRNLSQKHPDLSKNDLKHCVYIVMGLDVKSVSELAGISPRSVESARYRLKKKLTLGTDESIHTYLISFTEQE